MPLRDERREPRRGGARIRRWCAALAVMAAVPGVLWVGTGCSPLYVLQAGWAEAKILRARQPIPDLLLAPETDERTRSKLALAREAREFARAQLALDVGDSYTTFVQLERDTLAMVLSAAYRDRLAPKTWWFPVVGRVPYRGYFDLNAAQRAQRELEDEGFDTYLRPTAAFSTLGWFADPLLSTVLRYDEVELAATIVHELSHNHLYLPGRSRFNESFATWVGRVGAIEFFCTRDGGGPDTVWCGRAHDRWEDAMRFSAFVDDLVAELQQVYGDSALSAQEKLARRDAVFERRRAQFKAEVQPRLRSLTFGSFLALPLNNATLLSRMRYYHRLPDFQEFLERHGASLAAAVAALAAEAEEADDPFDLLARAAAPASDGPVAGYGATAPAGADGPPAAAPAGDSPVAGHRAAADDRSLREASAPVRRRPETPARFL